MMNQVWVEVIPYLERSHPSIMNHSSPIKGVTLPVYFTCSFASHFHQSLQIFCLLLCDQVVQPLSIQETVVCVLEARDDNLRQSMVVYPSHPRPLEGTEKNMIGCSPLNKQAPAHTPILLIWQ